MSKFSAFKDLGQDLEELTSNTKSSVYHGMAKVPQANLVLVHPIMSLVVWLPELLLKRLPTRA